MIRKKLDRVWLEESGKLCRLALCLCIAFFFFITKLLRVHSRHVRSLQQSSQSVAQKNGMKTLRGVTIFSITSPPCFLFP